MVSQDKVNSNLLEVMDLVSELPKICANFDYFRLHGDLRPVASFIVKKRCSRCGEKKELGEFFANKVGSAGDGRRAICKVCAAKDQRECRDTRRKSGPGVFVDHKVCPKCKIEQPVGEFFKNATAFDGLNWVCKKCSALKNKGKERLPEGQKRCPGCKVVSCVSEWGKSVHSKDGHTVYCKPCMKERRRRVSEQAKDYQTVYRQKNAAKIRAVGKRWHAAHRQERNLLAKARYQNDVEFRLILSTRSVVGSWFRRGKKKKSNSTHKLVGISKGQYRRYIESLFWPGMNWGNWSRSGWQIDHILPVASFDKNELGWEGECSHYTNTQPLWADDNGAGGKSDRLDWDPVESKHELPERFKRETKTYWKAVF